MRFLILAGTSDGRLLANELKARGYQTIVSTLTAYGAELAEAAGISARYGALDEESFLQLLEKNQINAVIDATHPFACRIHELAKDVCNKTSLQLFRWQRPSLEIYPHPLIHWAENLPSAARLASKLGGRILLTTGSNLLPEWLSFFNAQHKEIFVRVLPSSQILNRCESLGLKPYQVIAAQGPFSLEWNTGMFKQLKIDVVISKESGISGGLNEKVQACLNLNLPIIIVKRPEQERQLESDTKTINQFIEEMERRLCLRKSSY